MGSIICGLNSGHPSPIRRFSIPFTQISEIAGYWQKLCQDEFLRDLAGRKEPRILMPFNTAKAPSIAAIEDFTMIITQNISEAAETLLSKIRSCIADTEKIVSHSVTGAYVGAKKKARSAVKRTDKTIRDNPYQSLAISLGLGLAMGVFLSRRSK